MPTCATAHIFTHAPKRNAVTNPPKTASLNGTLRFGRTANAYANASEAMVSVMARRKIVESRNQMSPSETHLVSQVAPMVATMICLATARIGTESARAAKIGSITAVKMFR